MAKIPDNPYDPTPPDACPEVTVARARPVLRLVKPDPVVKAVPVATGSKPVSPFGRFMTAYADAIDAQIEVILSIKTD